MIWKYLFFFIYAQISIRTGQSIGCFKCTSVNGDNPACEDPFHNNVSDLYETPCMGGRKGRDGLYPASDCIKITGHYDDSGETMMIRGCALDSGTLTTDTEIIRMSHCGYFYFNDRYVTGCVQSCNEMDGCNAANFLNCTYTLVVFAIVITTFRNV
ncbi:uncharacterized protein LOC111712290 [Eurytemora carolleeae]|uniref:uncharacterized protein LOC111712290 n=1 Tax=Eurytemora carolleeae TaxID=1294199 RepID=UPI000C78202A|nr:uncharacterized protein LOC111712290 [Eurytemora carolleeae]|eukprot:XP_023342631.1 uncharacterized protein LOC111712290 [Eurytemora affinis]